MIRKISDGARVKGCCSSGGESQDCINACAERKTKFVKYSYRVEKGGNTVAYFDSKNRELGKGRLASAVRGGHQPCSQRLSDALETALHRAVPTQWRRKSRSDQILTLSRMCNRPSNGKSTRLNDCSPFSSPRDSTALARSLFAFAR